MMLSQYVCASWLYACFLGTLTESNECSHVCSGNLIFIYLIFSLILNSIFINYLDLTIKDDMTTIFFFKW